MSPCLQIYNVGNICAAPTVPFTTDIFGRRAGMFVGAVIIIIGSCVQATAQAMPQFMGGRFLLGFGVSYCCIAAPTYVSEVAHPKVCCSHVVHNAEPLLISRTSGEEP